MPLSRAFEAEGTGALEIGSSVVGEAHLGSRRKRQDDIGLNFARSELGLSLSLDADTGNLGAAHGSSYLGGGLASEADKSEAGDVGHLRTVGRSEEDPSCRLFPFYDSRLSCGETVPRVTTRSPRLTLRCDVVYRVGNVRLRGQLDGETQK
jgi:hypothetical protein